MTAGATRPRIASVALPSEHGGWSLTIEPALLGVLVAPSVAGALLAVAAMVAFLIRVPLRIVLVDLYRRRRRPVSIPARRLVVGELSLLGGLAGGAAALAEAPFWPPLVAALPLALVVLGYDMRSRSRRLVPELLGPIAIAAAAPAIALAGGVEGVLPWGLWAIVAARVIAAIPFVRVQIRRARERTGGRATASDSWQLVAVAVALVAAPLADAPAAGVVAVIALALVHIVLVRLPPPRVPVLGAQQGAVGLGVVLATGLGALAP